MLRPTTRFVAVRLATALALLPSAASAMSWCVANRSRSDLVYVHAITVSPCKDYTPVGGDGDQVLRAGQVKQFSTGACIVQRLEIRTAQSKGGDAGDIKVDFDSGDRTEQAMNSEKTTAVVIEDASAFSGTSNSFGIRARHAFAPGVGVQNAVGDIDCSATATTGAALGPWTRAGREGATDIAVAANGRVWALGNQADAQGNYSIMRRDGEAWTTLPAARGLRISADAKGNAWVVNAEGLIYHFDGTNWVKMTGSAKDIGVGANGKVWVIGIGDQAGGNFNIFRLDGENWTQISGAGVRIAVDPDGAAWIVNRAGTVSRFANGGWVAIPGINAIDIGIGADGTVLALNISGEILKPAKAGGFGGGGAMVGWTKVTTPDDQLRFRAISVDPRGAPWGVSTGGDVRHR